MGQLTRVTQMRLLEIVCPLSEITPESPLTVADETEIVLDEVSVLVHKLTPEQAEEFGHRVITIIQHTLGEWSNAMSQNYSISPTATANLSGKRQRVQKQRKTALAIGKASLVRSCDTGVSYIQEVLRGGFDETG